MDKMVLGMFENQTDASDAISRLSDLGYNPKDMSIVMKDARAARDFSGANEIGNVTGGTVTGAAEGAIVGALAGLLGAFIIPGLGAFLVGGPIALALGLTGAAASTVSGAATGAVAGGLIGALANLGLSEDEARVYEQRVNEGGILVAVPAKVGEGAEVEEVLAEFGANQIKSISQTGTQRGEEDYPAAYYSEVSKGRRRG